MSTKNEIVILQLQSRIEKLEIEKAVFLNGWKALNAEKAELVEALRDLFNEQTRPYEHRHGVGWQAAMDKATVALSKHTPVSAPLSEKGSEQGGEQSNHKPEVK